MAVSAKETRYFDLLFAFHITKENYRQAARAMYLQAQQVRKLEDGLNSLNIQEAALLMAINCLKLAKVRKTFFLLTSFFLSGANIVNRTPPRGLKISAQTLLEDITKGWG